MSVYVLNKHGHPLMPCSPSKARHLLKDGKAIVKKRTPFTIQLKYGSSGYKQPIILGVDAGSKTIGLSACTENAELFAAEVTPRNDVLELLSTRREFRRSRRNSTGTVSPGSITVPTLSRKAGLLLLWKLRSRSISPLLREYVPCFLSPR